MPPNPIVSEAIAASTGRILEEILEHYALPQRGDHGVVHWARVLENGLCLAPSVGAVVEVVTLFALFHDACRVSDWHDRGHGQRGAELAKSLRTTHLQLDDADFSLLFEACRLHTAGPTTADPTIQACWDADRLDFGRVGITPRAERLCTDAARDLIEWAHERAVNDHEPWFVREVWGV